MWHIKQKEACCLVDAFRGFGFKVPYVRDGSHRVLEDGLEMLRLFGYTLKPVPRICSTGPGRWIACRSEHCFALWRKGEGHMLSIDGADRKRVAIRDLDTLVKGTNMFQAPRRRIVVKERVILITVCVSPPREIAPF